MASPTDLDLDGDRADVYRFVERNGPVAPSEVAETLGVDPERFQHHVSILKRNDLVETTDDGKLTVALHHGEAVEHYEAGVSYEIRPSRPADLSGVVGTTRTVTSEEPSIVAKGVAEQLAYEDTLVRWCPTRCRVVFVATVDDDVVGWVHVAMSEVDELASTAELTLGVMEAYRRHGIGSHLLARGVEWAASRGCRKVYNSLPATNELAVDFLRDAGWSVEAVRPDHYEIEGELVDEVMLARRFDAV
jgi:ribosomal protein S18 acetylase RimI-like enzyme